MLQVFESESCRVWTGSADVPLLAIEAAKEHEMEAIPFCVQIWLQNEPKVATVADRSPVQEGLYLVRARAVRTGVQPLYTILLPTDTLSCFSIHRSSPFTSTVLVVLDVIDEQQQHQKQQQQVYFFGNVRETGWLRSASARKAQLTATHGIGACYDPEGAEKLLAALHLSFPSVKLSSLGMDCVKKQKIGYCRVAGLKISEVAKQRKTLSAEGFYGSNIAKSTAADVSDVVMSNSNWSSFYQKLQFRVSHSLMCQLEGSAPISSSFPRQQEAFDFADQVAALRRRVYATRGVLRNTEHDLRDHLPRVFSYESAKDGKRRFLVASFTEFWKCYIKTHVNQRHVYEVIREGVPCRLYFDLEFKRAINSQADGDALVARLLSLLQLQLYRRYGIHVCQRNIYQLDSSTPAKFSRHIILHLPNDDLFADNSHAGAFVRELVNDLVGSIANGGAHYGQLLTPFLVNSVSEDDAVGVKQLFIDTGVYTRNRMFRVLGSSKYKKQAILCPLNASLPSTELDQALFLSTLVCPYPDLTAVKLEQQTKPFRLLRCKSSHAVSRSGRHLITSGARSIATSSVECQSSIYPALDAFVRSRATTGGVQGEIRAVQMLYPSSLDVPNAMPCEMLDQEQSAAIKTPSPPDPWMIIYHMMRNRWCANIGRPHKSNNVMYIVDIDQRVFYQKCHDPVCHAMDFRSPPQPLPTELNFLHPDSGSSNWQCS
ncbi:unnamed protein product [Hyaloperonospora brassicae]|uniref:DNA-directed primase/polymerase protein n=1 Tax=Hyaloperonospora brassicae TaxID=162125 RepID=A0AAV0T8M2_HYABA|nr:unnamed protein product [Hyaloperonospora brassicae]